MPQLVHEEIPQLDKMLCFALYTSSRAVIDAYRPLLDNMGITYPQFLVLALLWDNQIMSVKAIGKSLYLDSGTLSPMLKRLETAGFVRRVRRTEDERIVDIALTPKGRELRGQALKVPTKVETRLGLSTRDLTHVMSNLQKVTRKLLAPV